MCYFILENYSKKVTKNSINIKCYGVNIFVYFTDGCDGRIGKTL